MSKRKTATPFGLLLAAVLGCGGGDGDGGPSPTTAIAKTSASSGDAQSGRVGEPLAEPLRVVVTEDGAPLSGATVTWSTTATGGDVVPPSGVTGADGVASTMWTLGTIAGAQTAAATLSGASGSPVSFSATATPGLAAALAEEGGNGQTGEINSPLPEPVQASVTDQFGNAVAGVTVNWTATGAAVSAAIVPSDATGISEVAVTLGGTAGPITIIAASEGLDGSPLTFTATATEPAPIPTTADVTVRNNNFFSVRNTTSSPAVDTVAVGGTVTWTWAPTATNPHNITSTGTPTFPGRGDAVQPPPYSHTFTSTGTYNYLCTIHGTVMSGRIVVR